MKLFAAASALLVMLAAQQARADSAFERGVARFRAEDFAGAEAPLQQARAEHPDDADTALLLGITYYKLGRADDALPLLEQAEAHGDADSKASARVFLGLIADERGEPGRARGYYELVARSPTELGTSGKLLLDQSGPERWSLVAILRPGYDSNVALQPATATVPPGPGRGGAGDLGDAELSLIGGATVRPSLALPLVVDDTLLYRSYARDTAYNMLADTAGATYTFAGLSDRATAAYHFEAETLGGARYELAHVADASYRHLFAGEYGIGARYSFAARDYALADYAGYTGMTHTAGADLSWGTPGGASGASLGYVFERENTDDPTLSSTGHGARGELHARLAPGTDLRASALALHRTFDPDSMGRVDTLVRTDAALYIDLSSSLGIVVGGTLVRNASNAADFDFTKWTAFAGLVATTSPR